MKSCILLLLATFYCIGEATWNNNNLAYLIQKGLQPKSDVVERLLGKLGAGEGAKKIADLLKEPEIDVCATCRVMMNFLMQNT